MKVDLTFVIRGAAGVDPAISNGRLEGRRLPLIERLDGLNVIVAVHQYGRGIFTGLE